VKKRVSGGTEAMSCIGENTAMKMSGRARVALLRQKRARAPPFDPDLADRSNSSLTAMSDYDFRPTGSLNLKRAAGDGGVKKCAVFHLRYHVFNSR
jgi:hypothetical protein